MLGAHVPKEKKIAKSILKALNSQLGFDNNYDHLHIRSITSETLLSAIPTQQV